MATQKSRKPLLKEMVIAEVQAAGGAELAFYTYKNSESLIWPFVYSIVTLLGIFNFLRNVKKIFWKSQYNKSEGSSPYNVATGIIIYCGSVYAFSEAWKLDSQLWIPCLGIGALGLAFATSSLKSISTLKPLLVWCRLTIEFPLILLGTTYLLHFRNHEEKWLYCLLWVATGETVYTIIIWFLKGCVKMEEPIFHCIIDMISGSITFLYACVCIGCKDYAIVLPICLFVIGCCILIIGESLVELFNLVLPPFKINCQRVIGPVLTVYSSLAAVYVGYSTRWWFFLVMLPLISAGINARYESFQ